MSNSNDFWKDYLAIKNEPNQARKTTMAKQYEVRYGKTLSSLDVSNLGIRNWQESVPPATPPIPLIDVQAAISAIISEKISTPAEMVARIDRLGNAVAIPFSDRVVLQRIEKVFCGWGIGDFAKYLAQNPVGDFDYFARQIKMTLINSCLRGIQWAVCTDDTIKEGKLDNVYPILKPLVSFYQQFAGDSYRQFGNFRRGHVLDFLQTHKNDLTIFGGDTSLTSTFDRSRHRCHSNLMITLGQSNKKEARIEEKRSSDEYLRALSYEYVGCCLCQVYARHTWGNVEYWYQSIREYAVNFILSGGTDDTSEINKKQMQKLNDDAQSILQAVQNNQRTEYLVKTNANPYDRYLKLLDVERELGTLIYYTLCGNNWRDAVQPVWQEYMPNIFQEYTSNEPTVSHFSDSGFASSADVLQDALDELNELEGLASVKTEISNLIAFLKIQKQRIQHGMKGATQSLHYVFHGNPGTGKTTVARILAKIFNGFELLKTDNLTETDRSGLVGGYVGQTAIKTDEVIQESLDGVLFIDEAYTLSKGESGNDYGQEAIDTLLKRMEDNRDRLIVIVAGYPALMQNFIRSNPGLASRFTRSITFEDYSPPEMCRIFANMCKKEEYILTRDALAYACVLFSLAHSQRDEFFGNARFVRNVYENTVMKHSTRLSSLPDVTKEILITLDHSDIPFNIIPNFDVNGLDFSQSRWSGSCPGCQKSFNAKLNFIGQRVTCKKCGETFEFPWWNPVPETIAGMLPNVFDPQ